MSKKNVLSMAAVVLMMTVMTACGGQSAEKTTAAADTTVTTADTTAAPAADASAAADTTAAEAAEADSIAADTAATGGTAIEGPYLVTSCGQSPGAVMVNMVALQGGLTSVNDNGMKAADLASVDCKTLIVTTGTSMKGMGAAGTDVNAEIERCVALIEAAKEAGIKIVGAHVEGMARRTDSSDTASIEAVMALSDVILVIEDSDSDGYFTKYAQDNNKPLVKVKDALEIASVLK